MDVVALNEHRVVGIRTGDHGETEIRSELVAGCAGIQSEGIA